MGGHLVNLLLIICLTLITASLLNVTLPRNATAASNGAAGKFVLKSGDINGRQCTSEVNITIVENAMDTGAVCLDGSPAGYHFFEGFEDGVDSWMIYLPGGGWCATSDGCVERVKTQPDVSSTINITSFYFGGILSSSPQCNPDFYNWNKVYLRYCDGSSFTGDVEAVDPATNLHYRGSRIFIAIVNEILAKGMNNAKNVILVGNSAGGLATILNCDRFRALVPNATRLKCVSDSGFFVRAKDVGDSSERETGFANVVRLHGVADFLPESCTSRMDPGLCFFPENLVGDIQTPLFLLNSDFDKYQIGTSLKPCPADKPGWDKCVDAVPTPETCTPSQLQTIKDFRNTFLETLKDVGDCTSSRGLFINSCYIHDYAYSCQRLHSDGSPRLENKTIGEAIGDWYFDRSEVKLVDYQTESPVDCHVG